MLPQAGEMMDTLEELLTFIIAPKEGCSVTQAGLKWHMVF